MFATLRQWKIPIFRPPLLPNPGTDFDVASKILFFFHKGLQCAKCLSDLATTMLLGHQLFRTIGSVVTKLKL